MRKLKLQVQLTLDGFMCGLYGEMDWMTLPWDDQLKSYVQKITDSVDCIVLGRKLAEKFIPYWASSPKGEDALGIKKMNETQKVVFTKTLVASEWANTILATGDLEEEITRLKNQTGRDLIAYGGVSFVSALVRHSLIDEFNLFINPTLIGRGQSICLELEANQTLWIKKATSFPCGIVALRYVLAKDF
ncbi:dihydrofolate reductase [Sphaerochaeta pleomorpha str. Grapes]|uniref:Dihydrofolate reductase n=1 Tax=Sphaerochaeta pleomorpha (strain ATCC BAA-1885 / DSM 22778 / Grapes) TaxID=158190 RepID=G8QST6_SPHPG|nr:dihydrofolate reductase family protein [Sphaerochaeta pleomorpha]AEV30118.1 dihydrofolate reductase [Sphaerochaeta pleomorpha str. Grapes]